MPGSIDALHNPHSTRDKLVALAQLHDRRTNARTHANRDGKDATSLRLPHMSARI